MFEKKKTPNKSTFNTNQIMKIKDVRLDSFFLHLPSLSVSQPSLCPQYVGLLTALGRMFAAANRTDRVNSQLAHRGADPERRAEGFDVGTRGRKETKPQKRKTSTSCYPACTIAEKESNEVSSSERFIKDVTFSVRFVSVRCQALDSFLFCEVLLAVDSSNCIR